MLFLLIDSPMFTLNKENFEDFTLYLRKISSQNGKVLTKEDFSFLAPYMTKESRKRIFSKNDSGEQTIPFSSSSSKSSNSDTNEKQIQNINSNVSYSNNNIISNFNNNLNNNILNNNIEEDTTYVSVNNFIYSSNNELMNLNLYKKRDSIFVKDSEMKDTYLLSLGEDADVPAKSLFEESKIKDFAPLDLLRFQSQIKNF